MLLMDHVPCHKLNGLILNFISREGTSFTQNHTGYSRHGAWIPNQASPRPVSAGSSDVLCWGLGKGA